MKFLLYTLLMLFGLNLILARSVFWNPYGTYASNPWPTYDYSDELFALPSRQNSDEGRDFELLSKLFDKSPEDSKEQPNFNTRDESDERGNIETVNDSNLYELESYLNKLLGEDESKETINGKIDNDEDNDEKDNTAVGDKENDDNDNSQEQKPGIDKKSSEEKEAFVEHFNLDKSSEESIESLNLKNNDEYDGDHGIIIPASPTHETSVEKLDSEEISERDIRELTAVLMTLSTLDDLMKIAENSSEGDEWLDNDKNEKKLKQVNDYLTLFGSILNEVLDESSEVNNGIENSDKNHNNKSIDNKTNNNDDNEKNNRDNESKDDKDDTKDDNDGNNDDSDEYEDNKRKDNKEDSNVSFEFHGLQSSETNLDNHIYNVFQSSTPAIEVKPTSSPYFAETFSSNADDNNVIQAYAEVREKLDTLQDNLLVNKLNMDKHFYNIIANESDDRNMKDFENDLDFLRENAYKIKQNIDDIQDIKTKLYFHKLIKAALKEVQFN